MEALNEWNIKPDPVTFAYHMHQQAEPYRSTVHFADFIEDHMRLPQCVADVGCGAGGPTSYLAEKWPNSMFLGLDISEELVSHAIPKPNILYQIDDLHNLKVRFGVDAVVSMQVLSWMPNYQHPLHMIATRLRPRWIAFSSLIYDGDIDCKIVVTERQRPRQSYYNVYGLEGLQRCMSDDRYELVKFQAFDIDIELPRPNNKHLMGTYTQHGMQFSGPLYLPWGFVMFERAA